jgi:antitoxin component YwqK of YwqJK toxin-antitoxin module
MYQGQFKSGFRQGLGICNFENGKPQYDGSWKDDKAHGKGTYYYRSGDPLYEGKFENGLKNGYGTEFANEDGRIIYQGEWLAGTYSSQGASYYKNSA